MISIMIVGMNVITWQGCLYKWFEKNISWINIHVILFGHSVNYICTSASVCGSVSGVLYLGIGSVVWFVLECLNSFI